MWKRAQRNDCGTSGGGLLLRGRAFTLIELLIVIAMLTVLSGAFFTVVIFTIRAGVEEDIRSTLRREGLAVVRSILHDTQLARAGDSSLARLLPAAVLADTQTLALEMMGGDKAARRAILYRADGERLERVIVEEATTPTAQTLAGHVRRWRIARSGDLVGIELELAINRYTRDFTASYGFATRVGQVANLSYRKE